MPIYRNTPYDPVYHSNIPRNYHQMWKQKTNRPLDLTDEEIFTIWKLAGYDWPDDEEFPDIDSWILSCLEKELDKRDIEKETSEKKGV